MNEVAIAKAPGISIQKVKFAGFHFKLTNKSKKTIKMSMVDKDVIFVEPDAFIYVKTEDIIDGKAYF